MATLNPDQAQFLRSFILGGLEREHATTRRVIEAIPPDHGDYRPDAIVKSANDLAWHIVGAEHRFLEAVINGAFDFSNTGRPESLRSSTEIARWYGETFPRDAERVAALPVEALTRIVDFRGIFQLPAVMYLQTAQIHSIHHRGQLSMYLRPMGAKVPAIYGESFDSAQAKQAAR
jgi:uncharacterized damage-inducible protein DinB